MELFIKVAAGLIVAVLLGGCAWLRRYLRSRGPLAGEWDQVIPAQGGQSEKHDKVTCHHRGRRVFGAIERLQPAEQHHKKWRFEGRYRESVLFACFWSEDEMVYSFGVWLLTHVDENRLVGHYLRLNARDTELSEVLQEARRIPFTWNRKSRP